MTYTAFKVPHNLEYRTVAFYLRVIPRIGEYIALVGSEHGEYLVSKIRHKPEMNGIEIILSKE